MASSRNKRHFFETLLACALSVFICVTVLTRNPTTVFNSSRAAFRAHQATGKEKVNAAEQHDREKVLEASGSGQQIDSKDPPPQTAAWPRIFCAINTMSKNAKRIDAVNNTWAKHCDGYAFTMNDNPKNLEPVWNFKLGTKKNPGDTKFWLWDKIRGIVKRLHEEKLKDFDWFVKADDDSFYIIENLKQTLSQYDTEKPYYFGSKHWLDEKGRSKNITYASGGAGYVLSRGAIRKFVSAMSNSTLCRQGSYFHEDTEVGQCMKNAGVDLVTPLEGKKHSMLPVSVFDLVHKEAAESGPRRGWAVKTSMPKITPGWDCCSDRLISFHYVQPIQMTSLYYFIYKVKVAEPPST